MYREYKYGDPYNCLIFGGNRDSFSRIRKMANVTDKTTVYGDVIPHLIELGMATSIVRGRINLDFLAEYTPAGDELEEITDFDNIGLYYDLVCGNKHIGICETCGCLYRRASNSQKYCKDCSPDMTRKYFAEYMREYRANVKDSKTPKTIDNKG